MGSPRNHSGKKVICKKWVVLVGFDRKCPRIIGKTDLGTRNSGNEKVI